MRIKPTERKLFDTLEWIKQDIRSLLRKMTTQDRVDMAIGYLDGIVTFDEEFDHNKTPITDQRLYLAGRIIKDDITTLIARVKKLLPTLDEEGHSAVWVVRGYLSKICNLLGTRLLAQRAEDVAMIIDVKKVEHKLYFNGDDLENFIHSELIQAFKFIILCFQVQSENAEAEAKKGVEQ